MIRKMEAQDLDQVMEIWLNSNMEAHDFVPEKYWKDHYVEVKEMLPEAEVYVLARDGRIRGFIGLMDSYIAGIFVEGSCRSQGIGKQLLAYVKSTRQELSLSVYKQNKAAVRFYQRENFRIQRETVDVETSQREYTMFWKNDSRNHASKKLSAVVF